MIEDKTIKARILVVDDSEVDQLLLQEAFRATSVPVDITACFGGLQAIRRLRIDNDYDLIIADLVMPLMSGLEFLAALDKMPMIDDIPRMLLSSALHQHLPALGAMPLQVPYLSKPGHWLAYKQLAHTLGAATINRMNRSDTERFLRTTKHAVTNRIMP